MINALPRIAIAMHDYEAAVETFRTTFGMPVLDFSDTTVPDLGAHVGMCMPPGGSNIELMSPANPDLPLSQALSKFLERRGEGLYALMLEAADPNAEAQELLDRDVAVLPLMAGAGGRDVHPRSTNGVLIRVYPDNSVGDHDQQPSGAPGLSGIAKVTVATADASKAADAYRRGLGLDVDEPVEDPERGVLSARARAPKGADIELVSTIDNRQAFGAAINEFVTTKGEGMYSLHLQADDPVAATERLGRSLDTANDLEVFGTRFCIEAA